MIERRILERLAWEGDDVSYIFINKIILLLTFFILRNIFNNTLSSMSSPSQLFSNVDAKAILDSPANDSTAKNHWTFNKDSRFKKPRY